MARVTSADIIAILRRFEIAGEENMPRHVELLKLTNTHPLNTLASFRFNRTQFHVLLDDEANDDPAYVQKVVEHEGNEIKGELLKNPNEHVTDYALPFRGSEVYVFEVASRKNRLDVTLAGRYPENSRSTWQKYIKAGHVTVNGVVQESVKFDVLEADAIAVDTPEATDYSDQELPIIYLDDNVIVINKPVGILSHAKGALNDEFTVADFFRRYSTYNSETNRPGIVHRLDRDTSGVMIGARNEATATMLQKQFADRKTKKTYMAILKGHPKQPEAKIDLPIGRNPSAPSTFRVDPKGKPAITSYHTIAEDKKNTLVELQPKTGRTHQLRVHMQYLGTPILGDRIYGRSADRLYLHAYALEVTIPVSDRHTFTAPVPTDFTSHFAEAKR